jgi:hypothetical protein
MTKLELLEKFNEKLYMYIKFTKKDETIREMICTRSFDVIPKEFHPSSSTTTLRKENLSVLKVFDLNDNEWKTIKVDSLISIY